MHAAIMIKMRNTDEWKDATLRTFPARGDHGPIAVVIAPNGNVLAPDTIQLLSLKEHSDVTLRQIVLPLIKCGYAICHTDTAE